MKREAMFYEQIGDGKVRCLLCPHNCVIDNGRTGVCKARRNENGKLFSLNYREVTSIALDPIEKKPLFHFYPGSTIISVGTWGCNFKCEFCQNWEISQQRPYYVKELLPEELLDIALEYKHEGNIGIAYTYSEPIVWYEFVYETSKLAKEKDLKNVLVTNGYINEEPLKTLLPFIDAMNIDLKAFNNNFYRKVCGGNYEQVLKTIETGVFNNVHVEVTTLVIPDGNDSLNELEEEFKALAKISPDIPLHLSRYHPAYKYTKPPTNVETLREIYLLAKRYLNYVYLGNVWNEEYESTYCPKCGSLVIIRRGYDVRILNLNKEGRCKACNNQILRRL
ncbi:MAG: AmmeMemoRadiSam system radical SAM enzyme [Fervidobacterium sp.]|uniref:Pyruvate formate lyase activating enzyme n=1 Tax=Fervidobacterium gondwanense DSM 13020 TaxID=1121883 RepID=A0A1M7SIE0_FERGO|nr:AmmeMemoRadiSam system radical SAM enzyme [Fervidobacterium gondwanense]UXF01633.1 pyruvate-formate lyase [Fervidobacterium riparium]SHN58182.1 pyruvate formate lyase activating enzyme [Fervidobacterium gondwanense DSM 13020]